MLFSNNNVTDVICRDLDGDKLSDILLLADTPRGQQYAYLVFFKNRGDGTFQKTERAISGTREFYGVYDFSMDGRPTAIASDGSQQFTAASSSSASTGMPRSTSLRPASCPADMTPTITTT